MIIIWRRIIGIRKIIYANRINCTTYALQSIPHGPRPSSTTPTTIIVDRRDFRVRRNRLYYILYYRKYNNAIQYHKSNIMRSSRCRWTRISIFYSPRNHIIIIIIIILRVHDIIESKTRQIGFWRNGLLLLYTIYYTHDDVLCWTFWTRTILNNGLACDNRCCTTIYENFVRETVVYETHPRTISLNAWIAISVRYRAVGISSFHARPR